MASSFVKLLTLVSCAWPAVAQLRGTVGPTTSSSAKAAVKVCNIMHYGGVARATEDNGAAIQAAWDDCKTGGQVLIPAGDYGLGTWVMLKNGKGVSINLEGIIYRTGTAGGNLFMIRDTTDFEFYSANSKGAIQGYGYEFHKDNKYGPRLLRLYRCTDFSVHDIALVDSPAFHLTLDTCTNGEIYNMIIRGGNRGGLDGIDVWGQNIWIHDVEVTNKDECVTVKSPANNILVEQVHCNWSGGCAMGSLGADVAIQDVEYRNIYTHNSNNMYMIKSNGGSGSVSNVLLTNFTGHSNAYTMDFNTAWSRMKPVAGAGIQYSNIQIDSWKGTCKNGVERPPIRMLCPAKVPCIDITIDNFHVWTEQGDEVHQVCQNAYGTGSCLRKAEKNSVLPPYSDTLTLTSEVSPQSEGSHQSDESYQYTPMRGELTSGLGLTAPIAIPPIPASFYPGKPPIHPVAMSAAFRPRSGCSEA